mgnify:FL=1
MYERQYEPASQLGKRDAGWAIGRLTQVGHERDARASGE